MTTAKQVLQPGLTTSLDQTRPEEKPFPNPQPRSHLASLLSERKVSVMGVVGDIADDDLGRAVETVAFWDQQPGVGAGLLVVWLRRGEWKQLEPTEDVGEFWRTGFPALVAELEAEGFSEREAPLAASAVMVRPKQPRGDALKAHVHRQYPWLNDNEEGR